MKNINNKLSSVIIGHPLYLDRFHVSRENCLRKTWWGGITSSYKNVDYVILWVVVRTSYGVFGDYKRDSGWLCLSIDIFGSISYVSRENCLRKTWWGGITCSCKNVDYVILWVVVRTSYGVFGDYKRDSGWLCWRGSIFGLCCRSIFLGPFQSGWLWLIVNITHRTVGGCKRHFFDISKSWVIVLIA